MLAQAEADPELAIETGIGIDLPPDQRQELLRSALEAVRSRCCRRAAASGRRNPRRDCQSRCRRRPRNVRLRDFAAAKRYVGLLARNNQLNEAALMSFAKQRKSRRRCGTGRTVALRHRRHPPADAEPARGRHSGAMPDRQLQVGRRRHPRQPFPQDQQHARTQHGKAQYVRLTLDNANARSRFWQVKPTDAPNGMELALKCVMRAREEPIARHNDGCTIVVKNLQ